ncbi:aminodeoxychorismate/anthranilate synthase component II [Sphingomonas sp.]|uniref:anthranilate synthase component II n=1 Tax=Sphingomonas sp. TaxID=28214 RepID=UPI00286E76C1|nr:aminodeoxychorismate/anthranilate synthase component II [Sphingomonas sp.]
MAAPRVLVLDNYDSFTFTLVDYLKSLGAEVVVARADALGVGEALAPEHDAILISPGPGTPADAGISVALAAACIEARRPLLGVCLGHQAIAAACGSAVTRAAPVHGKAGAVRHDGSGLFAGLPSPFAATRYHSLAVPDPRPPLIANAWSKDGLVMGLRHAAAPVHGVQFHPESVATEHGHALLAAFLAESRALAA